MNDDELATVPAPQQDSVDTGRDQASPEVSAEDDDTVDAVATMLAEGGHDNPS